MVSGMQAIAYMLSFTGGGYHQTDFSSSILNNVFFFIV